MAEDLPQQSSSFDKGTFKITNDTPLKQKDMEFRKRKNHGYNCRCYKKRIPKIEKNKRKSKLSHCGATRKPKSFKDIFRNRRCGRRRRFTASRPQLPQNGGASTSSPGSSRENNASAMVYMPAKQFAVHYGEKYLFEIATNAFRSYLDDKIPKISIKSLYREHITSRFSVMSFIKFKCIVRGKLHELRQHLRELLRIERKKKKKLHDGNNVVLVDRAILGAARKALRNRSSTRVHLRRLDNSVFDGAKVVLHRLDVSTLRRYGVDQVKESRDTTVTKDPNTYEKVEKKGTEKRLVCDEYQNKTEEMAFSQMRNPCDIEGNDNPLVCDEDITVQKVCEEVVYSQMVNTCYTEGGEERLVFEEGKRDESKTEEVTHNERMNPCDVEGTERRLVDDEDMGVENETVEIAIREMMNPCGVEGTEKHLVDDEDMRVENETLEMAIGEMMNPCGVEGNEKHLVDDEGMRVENETVGMAIGAMMNPFGVEGTEEYLVDDEDMGVENETEEMAFGEMMNPCGVEGTDKHLVDDEDMGVGNENETEIAFSSKEEMVDQNVSEEIASSQNMKNHDIEDTKVSLVFVDDKEDEIKTEEVTFGEMIITCHAEGSKERLVFEEDKDDESKTKEIAFREKTNRCEVTEKRLTCNEDMRDQNVSEEIAFGQMLSSCDVEETEKHLVCDEDAGNQNKTVKMVFEEMRNPCDVEGTEKHLVYAQDMNQNKAVETAFSEKMKPCDTERTEELLVCEEDKDEIKSKKIASGQSKNGYNMEGTEKRLVGDENKTEEIAFGGMMNQYDIDGTKNLIVGDEDIAAENKSVQIAFGQMMNTCDIQRTEEHLICDEDTGPNVGLSSKKSGEILKRVFSDMTEKTKSHKSSKKLKTNKSCQTLPVAKAVKVRDFSGALGKVHTFPHSFSTVTADNIVNSRLVKNASPTKDIATATHACGPKSNENNGKHASSWPEKQKNIENIINHLRIQRSLEETESNIHIEVLNNGISRSKKSLENVSGLSDLTPSIKENDKPIKLYEKEEDMENSGIGCIVSPQKHADSRDITSEVNEVDTKELHYDKLNTGNRETLETPIGFDMVKLSTSNQNENFNEFPIGNELPPFKVFKNIRSCNVIENEPCAHVTVIATPNSSHIYGENSKNQLSSNLQLTTGAKTKFEGFCTGHDSAAKCVEESLYVNDGVRQHNFPNYNSEIEITFENINKAIEGNVNPQIKYNKVNSVLNAYDMRNKSVKLEEISNNISKSMEGTSQTLREDNSEQLNRTNDLANESYVQNVDSYFNDYNSFYDMKLKSFLVYPPRVLQRPEVLSSTLKRSRDYLKEDYYGERSKESGPEDLSLKGYKGTDANSLSAKFHKVATETLPSVDEPKYCVCAQSYNMDDMIKIRNSFKDVEYMDDAHLELNTNFTKDAGLSLNRAKTPNGKNYLKYTVEFLSKHSDPSNGSFMNSSMVEEPYLFCQQGTVNSDGCLSGQGDYDELLKRKYYTPMNY